MHSWQHWIVSISSPHHDDTFLQRIHEMVWTLQSELSMLASAYCIKFMGLQKTEYWAAYTWLQKYFHPFFTKFSITGVPTLLHPSVFAASYSWIVHYPKGPYQTKFIRMNQNLLLISSILAKRKLPQYYKVKKGKLQIRNLFQ